MLPNNPQNLSNLTTILFDYLKLESCWDGYSAVTISSHTVNDAVSFLSLLSNDHKLPISGPASDGEICFTWKHSNLYLELGFYGDGYYSYYFTDSEKDFFGDNISIKVDKIETQLINLLNKF